MALPLSQSPAVVKTRVFLSYSRKDAPFVERLASALDGERYVVDYDQAAIDTTNLEFGISAQDEWWLRLKAMIAAADVIVFVISPDSIASRVCDDELEHARNLGKRLIPVLRRSIDFDHAPERLRALNVKLSFENDDAEGFTRALDHLCAEVELDIDWHRRGTRLTRLAQQWDADGRPEGQLLRAGAIADADAWSARRPAEAPMFGALLLSFLGASRAKEEQDRARLELSELDARLQAGDALFESALVHVERAEHHHACECLLNAVSIASPTAIPARFTPTLKREGWARKAWTAAACISANLPERIAAYDAQTVGYTDLCAWFDGGRHVLLANGAKLQALRLEGDHAHAIWSLDLAAKIIAIAGARAAGRLCALGADGALLCVDLTTRMTQQAELQLKQGGNDAAGVVALTGPGDALVVARTPAGADRIIAEVFSWNALRAPPQATIEVDGAKPYWVGFSPEGEHFGVLCPGGLSVFDRLGGAVAQRVGACSQNSVAASNLSAFASAEYDLARIFQRPSGRESSTQAGDESQPILLEGAQSVIMDLAFLNDGQALLTHDAHGRLLLWRPAPEKKRGFSFSGMQVSQTFGRANTIRPSSRLEGLPNASAIAIHPFEPGDTLVVSDRRLEHWRLRNPTAPIETFPSLGACASVVVDATSGTIGAATEQGVWIRDTILDHGGMGRRIGPSEVVWDVSIAKGKLAATYPGATVRIWHMPEGREIQLLRLEADPMALAFAPEGDRVFVGLENGVLWEWSETDGLKRIGALGIGPITRLRVSGDGRLGAAVGRTAHNDDRMHGGVAIWGSLERRLIWTTHRGVAMPYDIDINRDGTLVLIGDMHEAIAVEAETGAVLSRTRPPQTDASKPSHVTALRFGPDDRTWFIGLWDGSIVHADILSKRVLTTLKAHSKYVSSIACDHTNGLLVTSSPDPHSGHLAVWRAWNPAFFDDAGTDRVSRVVANFEAHHGTFKLRRDVDEEEAALPITLAMPDDALAEARRILDHDEMRAGDLFAQAVVAERVSELSPDEKRRAGEALLTIDKAQAISLLDDAARAGSSDAQLAIGVHILGDDPRRQDWELALSYFEAAAERGHAHAAYLVGYYHDRIVRGLVGAVDWRALAAPSFGLEATVDDAEQAARRWYERAAAAGSALAIARLNELSPPSPNAAN